MGGEWDPSAAPATAAAASARFQCRTALADTVAGFVHWHAGTTFTTTRTPRPPLRSLPSAEGARPPASMSSTRRWRRRHCARTPPLWSVSLPACLLPSCIAAACCYCVAPACQCRHALPGSHKRCLPAGAACCCAAPTVGCLPSAGPTSAATQVLATQSAGGCHTSWQPTARRAQVDAPPATAARQPGQASQCGAPPHMPPPPHAAAAAALTVCCRCRLVLRLQGTSSHILRP